MSTFIFEDRERKMFNIGQGNERKRKSLIYTAIAFGTMLLILMYALGFLVYFATTVTLSALIYVILMSSQASFDFIEAKDKVLRKFMQHTFNFSNEVSAEDKSVTQDAKAVPRDKADI